MRSARFSFDFTDQRGYGGIEAFLAALVVGAIIYFFFFPGKFPKTGNGTIGERDGYCRDIIKDASAPTITVKGRTYKMVKQNVLMNGANYVDIPPYHHFGSTTNFEDPVTKKKYIIRNPAEGGGAGRSYKFASDLDTTKSFDIAFADYGIIMAFHADDNYQPIDTGLSVTKAFVSSNLLIADIYKAVDARPLPDWVLQCQDFPSNPAVEDALIEEQNVTVSVPIGIELYYPENQWSPYKAEEQLGWFLPRTNKFLHHTWWTPHCKPAIYLYPPKETRVNVQVRIPQGEFLYTDPVYPTGGWDVLAKPSGELRYLGNNLADSKGKVNYADGELPYLYYEGRIRDSAIEKPTTGFVKRYDELAPFFDELLPQFGLNEKESKAFKDYWLIALPKASYYFIGIVPQENVDTIEPLSITPKQDTTIRVSLYFAALGQFKVVTPPILTTPQRSGFTVVEWGGMLKRGKNHPFTCIQ